jgi:type II secretory pathway pseudopilin PulG
MNKRAFTLIELFIVVVTIGILTAFGLVAFNNFLNTTKEKVTENIYINMGTSLNYEFSKCITNISATILNDYKCNNSIPPDILTIENFYSKNNIKNPYDLSKNIIGKDPCVVGTIAIQTPSVGSYTITYINKNNQTIITNINSKWSTINANTSNSWTPINVGTSNCWTTINTGASNTWTIINP